MRNEIKVSSVKLHPVHILSKVCHVVLNAVHIKSIPDLNYKPFGEQP